MKKRLLFMLGILAAAAATAQSSKEVQWNCSIKKIADKTYEVHMSAVINGDYHMYAQDAGGEGPMPTAFTFSQNPLIVLNGKVREAGKLVSKYEVAWKHDVRYYEKTVDFIQLIRLKANVKTNFTGKVEYIVCNDSRCLPPAETPLQVNVGE